GATKSREQVRGDDFVALINSQRLDQGVFRASRPRSPFLQRRRDLVRWPVGERALRKASGPAVRGFEMIQQFLDRRISEPGRLGERAAFGGDAPDASVCFVAVGMAEAGLIMADDGIIPVTDVQSAVGTE